MQIYWREKILLLCYSIEFLNPFATGDFSAAAPKVCAVLEKDRRVYDAILRCLLKKNFLKTVFDITFNYTLEFE